MNSLNWFLHLNYVEDFLAMFDYWRVSCYGLWFAGERPENDVPRFVN